MKRVRVASPLVLPAFHWCRVRGVMTAVNGRRSDCFLCDYRGLNR